MSRLCVCVCVCGFVMPSMVQNGEFKIVSLTNLPYSIISIENFSSLSRRTFCRLKTILFERNLGEETFDFIFMPISCIDDVRSIYFCFKISDTINVLCVRENSC